MERQDAINALTEKENGLDLAVATPEASQPDSEADSMYGEQQKWSSAWFTHILRGCTHESVFYIFLS